MNEEISNPLLLEKKINDLKLFHQKIHLDLLKHSIACHYHGIHLHFKTKSTRFVESLTSLIPASWQASPSEEMVIYMASPEDFGHTPLFWSDESCQDCLSYKENTIAIQRDFAAMIDGQKVYLICDDSVGDGFYNFLRWYLSEKLMGLGKFVVHASCVLDKNHQAHLFLGHSGAGKTTITKLSSPRLVLGDDMNLVSLIDNVLYVEAGAIGGQFNSMIGYGKLMPVKACYWLKQSAKNECHQFEAAMAQQKLLASFANLHWPTLPQAKILQLMEFSMLALKTTPVYELQFKKDSSIWELLDP